MKKTLLLVLLFTFSKCIYAVDYGAIELYTQDELNKLIYKNQHLQRVKADDCQLVEDIEAHATKVKEPSYVYLWGDMLAWGVCVNKDAKLGMHYIELSAKQGLLPAIEQLGRYYEKGIFVQPNKTRAIIYYREAALQGFLNAQINYVRLLLAGYGSPVDYEEAYHVLFQQVIGDKRVKNQAASLLSRLADRMPDNIIARAEKNGI
ncbi:tetratricopeptide repeat protein [Psychromonas sp. PT13]|uniref:tetratricopeptide repeat protein n=1 Tax=Psychromonas sp. PT13 TaxID=3439547 RepID=UPI003EBDA6B9